MVDSNIIIQVKTPTKYNILSAKVKSRINITGNKRHVKTQAKEQREWKQITMKNIVHALNNKRRKLGQAIKTHISLRNS